MWVAKVLLKLKTLLEAIEAATVSAYATSAYSTGFKPSACGVIR